MINREAKNNSRDDLKYLIMFSDYFLNKALSTLVTQFAEEWLVKEGYGETEILQVKSLLYLFFANLQDSFVSGSAYLLSTEVFKNIGCIKKEAEWMGYLASTIVSLAKDFSSTGALKTTVSSASGFAGKWCTKWVYKNSIGENELESPLFYSKHG